MSGTVIVDPLTADGKIPVDSRPAREFGAVSAFGLPKFALERILKEYKFSESLLQISFIQSVTGTGTITTEPPFIVALTSGTTASTETKITTKQVHKHPVGKGLIAKFFMQYTDPPQVGNIRCFGLYNDNEGFYIELGDTEISFVTRKGGVDTKIPTSTWDIPVAVNINNNLWYIQSEGSGVGDYELWYNEQLVHRVSNLGVIASPSINTTDLPLRIENTNITNTTDVGLKVDGVSVAIEGEEAVIVTDGTSNITINASKRLNVQSGFSYLMDSEFDIPLDTVALWNTTTVGAATFTQPSNTFTLFLNTTTGATDDVLIKSKLLNLKAGTGEFCTFEVGMKFGTNNPANHVKEWGYLDSVNLNGVFYRLEGGVFKFVTVKGGVETVTTIEGAKPNANFHNFRIEHLGAGKIIGSIINEGTVVDFSPAATSQVGASEKQPFVRAYNTAAPASTPDDMECHWIRLLDNSGTGIAVRGRDDNNVFRDVAVNSSRRLLVSQEPVAPGPGETGISDIQFNSVSATTDTFTVIPSGKVVNVNSLSAGAEVGNGGSKVEVYEAPNGDATGIIFVAVLFVDGSNGQVDLSYNTTAGDGTRAILLRRERFGGGAVEIYGAWTGTYET